MPQLPKVNNKGFMLRDPHDMRRVLATSQRSALSRKSYRTGGVVCSVPGSYGLFVLLEPHEKPDAETMQKLYDDAKVWRATFEKELAAERAAEQAAIDKQRPPAEAKKTKADAEAEDAEAD